MAVGFGDRGLLAYGDLGRLAGSVASLLAQSAQHVNDNSQFVQVTQLSLPCSLLQLHSLIHIYTQSLMHPSIVQLLMSGAALGAASHSYSAAACPAD